MTFYTKYFASNFLAVILIFLNINRVLDARGRTCMPLKVSNIIVITKKYILLLQFEEKRVSIAVSIISEGFQSSIKPN